MKMRLMALTATALAVLAGPAAARCSRPYAPVVKINASTTKDDMVSLRSDLAAFIAASDVYQACLVAERSNPELIAANQVQKERIGREFNAALRAFNSGRPG